jgi:hypothetical protein
MGMHIAHTGMPKTNFKDLTPEEKETVESNDALAEDLCWKRRNADLLLALDPEN